MKRHRLFIVLPLIFCLLSCSGNRRSLDKKVIYNNIRYIVSSNGKKAFVDCLLIKQTDINNGICESTFDINPSIAKNIYFIRNKKVSSPEHNSYDDATYRLSLRFDNYADIDLIPLRYKITINRFPADVNSNIYFEDMLQSYPLFSYVWIPGYDAQFHYYSGISVFADIVVNSTDGIQKCYKLKFRDFCVAYVDEPRGEETIND